MVQRYSQDVYDSIEPDETGWLVQYEAYALIEKKVKELERERDKAIKRKNEIIDIAMVDESVLTYLEVQECLKRAGVDTTESFSRVQVILKKASIRNENRSKPNRR